jgi:Uma2 family endonuclease
MTAVLDREIATRQFSPVRLKEPTTRLLTVFEYDKMIEAGIFSEDDRIELLEGVLIEMSPKGPHHAYSTDCATKVFIQRLGDRAVVRNQNPILIDEFSEPEPDIVLATPDASKYANHHPTPGEIFAVIEVSDSSLAYDRHRKSLVYARAGIPQYLVLNVEARELEDYRDPAPDGYRSKQTISAEQEFTLVAFPEITFTVGDLLPPKGSEAL